MPPNSQTKTFPSSETIWVLLYTTSTPRTCNTGTSDRYTSERIKVKTSTWFSIDSKTWLILRSFRLTIWSTKEKSSWDQNSIRSCRERRGTRSTTLKRTTLSDLEWPFCNWEPKIRLRTVIRKMEILTGLDYNNTKWTLTVDMVTIQFWYSL